MSQWSVAVSLLLAVAAGDARGTVDRAPACPGGRFVTDAPLLRVAGGAGPTAVELDNGQVWLGTQCGAITAGLTRVRRGMLVRARWQACAGVSGPVRLRAVLRGGCAKLVGVVRARRHGGRFLATREPVCGNGIREGSEECDAAGCCTDDCRRVHDTSCAGTDTCSTDAECAPGSAGAAFCARPIGRCEGAGTCELVGDVFCTAHFDPVCGCDGKTYGNACEAFARGVNVAASGPCDARRCGTIAGLPCAGGEFCEQTPGTCQIVDAGGQCVAVPETCRGVFDPVCGCDGNTYVNDCYRRQAGVQKAHDRRCRHCLDVMCSPGADPVDTDGDGCMDGCRPHGDCRTNDDCPDPSRSFCEAPAGRCEGPGDCAARPGVCPELYAPVCGCDGQTYGNACEAAGNGARVAHRGPCACNPPPCAASLVPSDTDGDGCPDACLPACERACDCYTNPDLGFSESCPLACPNCGEYWTCEDGACRERCGPIPPGNDQCEPPSGFCTVNEECAPGDYCACGLGMCGGPGICVPRPDACTREYAPVCGCDGTTHANACEAAASGARVAHEGGCGACRDACDCGPPPLELPGDACPLCPAPLCGTFWSCEQGQCVAHCGVLPDDASACPSPHPF